MIRSSGMSMGSLFVKNIVV